MDEMDMRDTLEILVVIRDLLCDIRDQNHGLIQRNNMLVDLNIALKKRELEAFEEFGQKS